MVQDIGCCKLCFLRKINMGILFSVRWIWFSAVICLCDRHAFLNWMLSKSSISICILITPLGFVLRVHVLSFHSCIALWVPVYPTISIEVLSSWRQRTINPSISISHHEGPPKSPCHIHQLSHLHDPWDKGWYWLFCLRRFSYTGLIE